MDTATDIGYIEMRIAKVVGLGAAEDEPFCWDALICPRGRD
jgi:hypothetical protein